jgi:hypothetical protein
VIRYVGFFSLCFVFIVSLSIYLWLYLLVGHFLLSLLLFLWLVVNSTNKPQVCFMLLPPLPSLFAPASNLIFNFISFQFQFDLNRQTFLTWVIKLK